MAVKIDIDALKIYEQTRLKIAKKIRTASFNSTFTSSYKMSVFPVKPLPLSKSFSVPSIAVITSD